MVLKKHEVVRSVNPYLIHILDFKEEHSVFKMSYLDLITPNRFDIFFKYIYVKHYMNGYDLAYAKKVYCEHIEKWNRGVEGDLSGKNNIESFIYSFDQLLERISRDGFDRYKSYLPVGYSNIIIDGAHRAAACIGYKEDPWCIKFDHVERAFDHEYFCQLGIDIDWMDAAAIECAKLNSNLRMVFLFPVAVHKEKEVERILKENGNVFYKKNIFFNSNGLANLMSQLYRNEVWVGARESGWPGGRKHAENKFKEGQPLSIYLFECDANKDIRVLKNQIRSIFDLGNNSIHINDTYEETVRLSEQLFNQNSIHLFNFGNLTRFNKVHQFIKNFKDYININNLNKDEFLIDGSAILSLYGLRDSHDLDFLHLNKFNLEISKDIHSHESELKYYKKEISDLILNPKSFLYYDGIKYASLHTVIEMKKNRGEEKDLEDIGLSLNIEDKVFYRNKRKPIVKGNAYSIKEHVKKMLPDPLIPFAKKVYGFAKSLRLFAYKSFEYLKVGDLRREYLSFKLYYDKGTSIVDRIRFGKIYEPEVTTAILRELNEVVQPAVLDIGANIGLMSLNLINFCKDIKIYAFEPGPNQKTIFQRNIKENLLQKQITLYDVALSESNGLEDFFVHTAAHSSGDGFKDTKRAGKVKKISVKTKTLDKWWEEEGYPKVNLVKIDTEGAELKILRGATNFLSKLKPILVLEIQDLNLSAYDYNKYEVLSFLNEMGYILYTLDNRVVSKDSFEDFSNTNSEFIAKWKE